MIDGPRVPLLISLLLTIAAAAAQPTTPAAPDCAAADLDASFTFVNNPPSDQLVAIDFRNVSARACVLRGGNGAMFDDFHDGHNIWTKDCRNCSPDGAQKIVPPLTLTPGETGHFLLRWKNTATNGSEPCQPSDGFNTNVNSDRHSYLVAAPSLLTSVCSVVEADSYLPGPFPDKVPETPRGAAITLTSSDSVLYAGDTFAFQAIVDDSAGQLPHDDRSCPVAFIRTRAADGSTALEEISSSARCVVTPSSNGGGRSTVMLIRAPGLGVLNEPGSTSVAIYALSGSPRAHEIAMIESNALQINIVDPAAMPRTWGTQVKGVAVSLGLDKTDYKLGEDIPLRIAVENFSAATDIASGELPCDAGVAVEVRDSAGTIVPAGVGQMFCTGHGWQIGYPKGKVVPVLQLTLSRLGFLPDRPGTYTVAATWKALGVIANAPAAMNYYRPLAPWAVAHSQPVTFHVLKQDR